MMGEIGKRLGMNCISLKLLLLCGTSQPMIRFWVGVCVYTTGEIVGIASELLHAANAHTFLYFSFVDKMRSRVLC